MRLVVTRPLAQAQSTVAALRRQGLDAVALPLIDIVALHDVQPLLQAWQDLQRLACVMFVSANAVEHFMRQRPRHGGWPPQVLAASTGPGTSAALRLAGVPQAVLVEPGADIFDSEALWQQLQQRDWSGRRVLVVRGEGGRDWLAQQFGAAGARVDFVAAYDRALPRLDATAQEVLRQAVQRPAEHLWSFSSSQALEHLRQLACNAEWSQARAIASHPRVADAARRLGFGQVDIAPVSADALAAALRVLGGGPIKSAAP